MNDVVLSVHPNPLTCGVTKFNVQLAQRLGISHALLSESDAFACPLVSLKGSELPPYTDWPVSSPYDLFLHDADVQWAVILKARRIFAANTAIASVLKAVRGDITVAWCPSTLQGNPSRGSYRVLAFGMAHKLGLSHFQKLKVQLEQEQPDYTVSLSTAVHEGSPWAQAMAESVEGMRAIFGDKLRVLGFLGDDALVKELAECDAVACFYDPALRANNTTAWAALEAGKRLYTNTDDFSPALNVETYSWERLEALVRA